MNCTSCHIEKSLDSFVKRKGSKTGYRLQCKECLYQRRAKYDYSEYFKEYRTKNRDKLLNNMRGYYSRNLEKSREYFKEYRRSERTTNPLAKVKHRLSRLLHHALQSGNFPKNKRTQDIIGCTIPELVVYLRDTWDRNYPGIEFMWSKAEIDHIIPISSATTEEDIYKLNHYSNLQLLTKVDNIRKSNYI